MTDKSSVELGAIGTVHSSCICLLCDFHRAQAWERWVNKSANGFLPEHRDLVLSHLKDLAYVITGEQTGIVNKLAYIYMHVLGKSSFQNSGRTELTEILFQIH